MSFFGVETIVQRIIIHKDNFFLVDCMLAFTWAKEAATIYQISSTIEIKLPPRQRPSVFSRLGTKRSGPGIPLPPGVSDKPRGNMPIQCRNILESGTCKFDSKCKYAHTHKMAMQTRDRLKMRGPTGLGN